MYYVYRFLDSEGNVLYVGKTSQSLIDRLRGHKHLPQECYNAVREIEYIELDSGANMSLYEIYYINKYQPKYNTESKYPDSSTVLPEYTWKNFRELFDKAQDQSFEDIAWRGYKQEILDIAIEQESDLKTKRLEIKARLENIQKAVEFINKVVRQSSKPQMTLDNDVLLEYVESGGRESSEADFKFTYEDGLEFRKAVDGLSILQKHPFLKLKTDSGTKSICILKEIDIDSDRRNITLFIDQDYLCLLNIWAKQILSGNVKLLKDLQNINNALEILRNKLGKLYKRSDNDLDYLTKIFKEVQ